MYVLIKTYVTPSWFASPLSFICYNHANPSGFKLYGQILMCLLCNTTSPSVPIAKQYKTTRINKTLAQGLIVSPLRHSILPQWKCARTMSHLPSTYHGLTETLHMLFSVRHLKMNISLRRHQLTTRKLTLTILFSVRHQATHRRCLQHAKARVNSGKDISYNPEILKILVFFPVRRFKIWTFQFGRHQLTIAIF